MAGFFSFLRSGTKFVLDGDPDTKRIFPVYGSWREHPAIGHWYPRSGVNGSGGAHYCYGCGASADRAWLTEVPRPADESTICRVLMDREDDFRRKHGLPPTK